MRWDGVLGAIPDFAVTPTIRDTRGAIIAVSVPHFCNQSWPFSQISPASNFATLCVQDSATAARNYPLYNMQSLRPLFLCH
jgi:hypothetical protein